jgi:hypothetical protein
MLLVIFAQRRGYAELSIFEGMGKNSQDEIYNDFAKLYRRFKALNRKKVGDYFFKETEDLVDKLCDYFEATVFKTEDEGG